jgi:hypothetical protein
LRAVVFFAPALRVDFFRVVLRFDAAFFAAIR